MLETKRAFLRVINVVEQRGVVGAEETSIGLLRFNEEKNTRSSIRRSQFQHEREINVRRGKKRTQRQRETR